MLNGIMGWFFGFKLRLICNEKGELLNFMITSGDIDGRKLLEYKTFVDFIYGKLVGGEVYISKKPIQRLFVDCMQFITKLKSKMKGSVMKVPDRLLLRKRAIIETVNYELQNVTQVEHSRNRSYDNFIVNTLQTLAIYSFFMQETDYCGRKNFRQAINLILNSSNSRKILKVVYVTKHDWLLF